MTGKFPADWKEDRLKDVARSNADSLPAATSSDFEFNYIEISNVNYFGIVNQDAVERLRFEDAPSRARRIVKPDCTIISSVRPNLQAVAYFDSIEDPTVCSTGFIDTDLNIRC